MLSLILPMKVDTEVRVLQAKDSKLMAKLHVLAFPNFFLTTLGEKFLRTFYEKTLKSKNGFGTGVFEENKLISFALGTDQIIGFYKSLIKKNGFSLLFAAFPKLVSNPRNVLRILKNLSGNSENFQPDVGGWLLSICTDPRYQGVGVSQQCISAFEKLAKEKPLGQIWLTTDYQQNERANLFYRKMDYQLASTFTNANNRKMNLYSKNL
jgi:ribosomal protein S18 acetylase RimI-like enzyme